MPQPGQHAANFPILPLAQNDAQPGAFALPLQPFHLSGADVAVAEPDTFQKLPNVCRRGKTRHLNEVSFFDAKARVHQPIGQVAIVGQKQEPFAGLINPAHRVNTLRNMRNQVDGEWPAGRIVIGTQIPARLVYQPVHRLFGPQRLAVNANLLFRLNLGAQDAHGLTVHADPARENQLLAMPPRADPGMGQEFVQTLHADSLCFSSQHEAAIIFFCLECCRFEEVCIKKLICLIPVVVGFVTGPVAAQSPRLDQYGDPLPEGTLARFGTIRLRPGAAPQYLAFTPDSKKVVCCCGGYGSGNALAYYDVATGKELRRVQLLDSRALAFTMLAGGRGLALIQLVPGEDKFYLWEFTDPKSVVPRPKSPLQPRISHDQTVYAISPDGRWLATGGRPSGGKEKPVQVWPWTSGRMVHELKPAHSWPLGEKSCQKLLFSDQGELLAVCWKEGQKHHELMVFDLAKGKSVANYQLPVSGQSWPLGNNLALSPRQRQLAVGPPGEHGRILDARNGKELQRLVFATRTEDKKIPGLSVVTFSPDGGFLAAGDWEGWLHWWDVAKRRVVWKIPTQKYQPHLLAVSPDGRWLAGGGEGLVRLWETATGKETPSLKAPQSSAWQVKMSPDGRSVICASYGKLRQWDLATGKLLRALPLEGRFPCFDFEPGSRHLFVAHGTRFERWNLEQNRFDPVALGKDRAITGQFRFSADGKVLINVAKDKVAVWDWPKKTIRRTWSLVDPNKPKNEVEAWTVAVNKRGSRLVLFSRSYRTEEKSKRYDGEALDLWDAVRGKKLREFLPKKQDGLISMNNAFCLTPDEQGLVLTMFNGIFGGGAESLRWVDVTSGGIRRKFVPPDSPHNQEERVSDDVVFSPDGRIIASSERDHRIILYEAASGLVRRVLHGHRGELSKVVFSLDGRRLVSFNSDLTGLVWDLSLASGAKGPATAEQVRHAWDLLTNRTDGEDVQRSMALLAASADAALSLFEKQVRPVPPIDPRQIARLVGQLDDADFTVRTKATGELDRLGEDAWLLLCEHQKKSLPLEAARRLGRLVEKHDPMQPSEKRLRELRALEILEQFAQPRASKLLAELAKGAPSSRLTRDAAGALERLHRHAAADQR